MINFTQKYESIEFVSRDKSKLTYTATNIETKEKVTLRLYEKSLYKESKFDELKKIIQFSNINENQNLLKINNVDSGCYKDVMYYIVEMEYTEDETLDKLLEQKDFTENEALEIIKQIINGLHDLHRLNITYTQLSTEKIYISKDKTLKLDPIGYIDKYPQSIKYLSPEQVANKKINKTADIYSLGIILFEIINKKLPFVWEKGKKELYKSMTEEFYIDKDKCSLNVISIIENCLYVEPKDRYENLDAFLLDISSHLDYNVRTFRNDREIQRPPKIENKKVNNKLNKKIINKEEGIIDSKTSNLTKEDNKVKEDDKLKENNKLQEDENLQEDNKSDEVKADYKSKTDYKLKKDDKSKYSEYMKIISACAAVGIVSAALKFAGTDIIEGFKNKDNSSNTNISNESEPVNNQNKTNNQEVINKTLQNEVDTNTKTNTDSQENKSTNNKKYNSITIEDIDLNDNSNTDNNENKNENESENDTNTSQPSQDNNTGNNNTGNNNTGNNNNQQTTEQKPVQKPEQTPNAPQNPNEQPEVTPEPEQPENPETPTPDQNTEQVPDQNTQPEQNTNTNLPIDQTQQQSQQQPQQGQTEGN